MGLKEKSKIKFFDEDWVKNLWRITASKSFAWEFFFRTPNMIIGWTKCFNAGKTIISSSQNLIFCLWICSLVVATGFGSKQDHKKQDKNMNRTENLLYCTKNLQNFDRDFTYEYVFKF